MLEGMLIFVVVSLSASARLAIVMYWMAAGADRRSAWLAAEWGAGSPGWSPALAPVRVAIRTAHPVAPRPMPALPRR